MLAVTYAVRSDIGLKRETNEDNLYACGITISVENRIIPFSFNGTSNIPCLFAICDGMGGYADGDFASTTAINVLMEYAEQIKSTKIPDTIVQEYILKSNNILCDAMRERSIRMGTTLALVVVQPDCVHAYNLGDSRIYTLCGSEFKKISEDHTLASPKIKLGVLTDAQARKDKDWHRLTAYLGIFADELEICAEILPVLPAENGLRMLLCSDGLTDMVLDDRIEEIMRYNQEPDKVVYYLFEEALNNGGRDNITIIVFDIQSMQNGRDKL